MTNYIVIGLGMGDEGKGATVDYLCSTHDIGLVVRFNGGFQAAHNVVLPDGRHHTFSQFGSGTLKGVPTYLDRHVIIDPFSMRREAEHLKTLGVSHPYWMVKIHPDCLISTVYHKILNRVLDRRNGHGSCGVGIGATRQMWSETGDGIRFEDLSSLKRLRKKMSWVRQWCQDKLLDYKENLTSDINIDWQGNKVDLQLEVECLYECETGLIGDEGWLEEYKEKQIIFEGSQGYYLDEVCGTIPHTTYSNTKPTYALELCTMLRIERPKIYGITRAYETRHGTGPMYQESNLELKDDHNHNNGSFAGKFRVGWLNKSKLREAYDACKCDTMVMNCLDHIPVDRRDDLIKKFPEVSIKSLGPTSKDRMIV